MGAPPDTVPDRLPPAWPWAVSAAALAVLTAAKLTDPGGPGFEQAVNLGLDALMWVGAGMCLLRVARFRGERAPVAADRARARRLGGR